MCEANNQRSFGLPLHQLKRLRELVHDIGTNTDVVPYHLVEEAMDILNGLQEVKPIDPQPETPKDWSGHADYGDCCCCVHRFVDDDEYPCRECLAACRPVEAQTPHWQPRVL